MTVKVQFFGPLAEEVGAAKANVEVAGTTVGDVVEAACRALPRLRILPSVRFAVNTDYADRSSTVREGDVVSLIPPVGGG